MWKLVLVWVMGTLIPVTAAAWFETKVDTVETRYSDGHLQVQYQRVYWEGNESFQLHGFYHSWYENGRLERDGEYEMDSKVGVWVKWDSAGFRTEETSYSDGVKDGLEILWNPDGSMRAKLRYRNGKLHGLCTWYTSACSVNQEYNNGCIHVTAEKFYLDGIVLLPIRDSTDKPCIAGPITDSLPYHDVETNQWVDWNNARSEFHVGQMVNGQKHGIWTLWDASGRMKRVDVFEHGKLLEF